MSAGAMVLDAPTLQRRAMELLAAADEDPKRAAERIAAAEAHVRLVVIGHDGGAPQTSAARAKALKLLDRAVDLDPYRVDAYLLAALAAHREGLFDVALERYEQAASLAPSSVEIRFHCGFGFLDAARRPALSDEDAAELAEVASEHFEAVLALDPGHAAAALGAVESGIYGKATKLRDAIGRLFSRVAPDEAKRPTVTRLLYQAIFAFRVGKAKGVDQKNKKTMADIADVARAWLAAFPSDPGLTGVVGAAAAKCESAEDLCARLADHAAAIPDPRVLRLILRERLADVADPEKRLELFAGAMERVPPLDGITHDYLHLMHLVAKRAVAGGDVPAARAAWQRCQALDPENPGTTQNLLRLAVQEGNDEGAAQLDRRLAELWALYAEVSPRADLVIGRAAARAQTAIEKDLEGLMERFQKEEKRPSLAELTGLVHRWARAQALWRLAVDPGAGAADDAALARRLLATAPEDALPLAREVLARPLAGEPPVAYAFFGIAKDATDEMISRARDGFREQIERLLEEERRGGGALAGYQELIDRATKATQVLFDPAARAAYDASTCPTIRAEMYRRHAFGYVRLVELCSGIEEDVGARERTELVSLLREIPAALRQPYLVASLRDGDWLEVMYLRVRYSGLIAGGWKHLNENDGAAVVDVCKKQLAGAKKLASYHRLLAFAILADPRTSLTEAVESARSEAAEALRYAHWSDMTQAVAEMRTLADLPDDAVAQHAAAERALKLVADEATREAVMIVWAAYPGHQRKRPSSTSPAARSYDGLAPAGGGFYAFATARALRSNIIAWFNGSRPSSHAELYQQRRLAVALTRVAFTWARYAVENISADPLRGAAAPQIGPAIVNLMQALEKDEGALL